MHILKRLLRHNWFTRYRAKKFFPMSMLQQIEKKVAAGEKLHRAQICVVVEHTLPWAILFAGVSARLRAQNLFAQHQVWDTEENSGVLLYINVADRKIEIVTDRGVNHHVAHDAWKSICQNMGRAFQQKQYELGILSGLDETHMLLQRYFPADEELRTQLSDKPIVI